MELSPEAIRALLDAFDRSDWREMTVTVGNDRLHVSRDPSPNGASRPEPPSLPAGPAPEAEAEAPAAPGTEAATAAAPAPTAAAGPPPEGNEITSPSVGLFWRAPAPGAPPFVEVGDRVSAGETVAIVEVMKLMNHIVAPEGGVVTAILVENGAPVEFGQTLVVVDPAG